ncbi:MAG: OmpA family protein [Bacteroidetes bacterium]|nr:OmpA family protein [Bacteroidota bacterium]
MILKTSLTLLSVSLCLTATAQLSDTLVYAEGKIYNHQTKEPVHATISYESLPYGDVVCSLSGTSYKFPFYEKTKYSITVEAPGYATAKYMLDPASANTSRIVMQDIEMGLPPKAEVVAETTHHVGKVMRLDALVFQQRSSIISPESYPELNSVAKMLHDNPRMVIQLEGHTDTRGDAKLNLKLSEDRVEAVRDYLVTKGVTKSRIKLKAFGGTMPLSKENTEEAHRMNRRVEVRVLEN